MEKIFTNIYESNSWGNNNNLEYKGSSGAGSGIEYNKNEYIPLLKELIIHTNIKKIVDLGCGDFRCGKLIYDQLDVSYIGYESYKKIIEYNLNEYLLPKYFFIHLDFYTNKENIVSGEFCILKDVLQHWPTQNIYQFLDYLSESKKFKYILICNCCDQTEDNADISNGYWRPLSCDYMPLKKYNPIKLLNYNTKEYVLSKYNSNNNYN